MNDLPRSTHPLDLPGDHSRAIIALCDDTVEEQGEDQVSANIEPYYYWHTLLIEHDVFHDVQQRWQGIKTRSKIPNTYLHCHLTEHRNILLDPDSQIRSEIDTLLEASGVYHVATLLSHHDHTFLLSHSRSTGHYESLQPSWDVKNPKGFALVHHLCMLDRYSQIYFPDNRIYAFCDKTERSDSKFGSRVRDKDGWAQQQLSLLDHVDKGICFRISKTPVDPINSVLDLADYLAWTCQRVFRKTNLRDFGQENWELTDEEWEVRLQMLGLADQQIAKALLKRINTKKTVILGPASLTDERDSTSV